jgi:hypothetical protein
MGDIARSEIDRLKAIEKVEYRVLGCRWERADDASRKRGE